MYLPLEMWNIIFKFLDFNDIQNLLILYESKQINFKLDIEETIRQYYNNKYSKLSLVKRLLFTYKNIEKINYIDIYMNNFFKNYNVSSSPVISYYVRESILSKICNKNKKKFKNLTYHIGLQYQSIRDVDIKKYRFKNELEFYVKHCI